MTEDHPDVYVNGEPVIIRGIERRNEQLPESHPSGGGWRTHIYAHVDFVESPEEYTTCVNFGQLTVDGGLPVLNDYLLERGLVPEFFTEAKSPPTRLDE